MKSKVVAITDYPLKGTSFGNVALKLFSKLCTKYDIDVLSLGYTGLPIDFGFRILPLDSAIQIGFYNKHIPRDVTLVFHSFYFLEKLGITSFPSRSILYIPVEASSIPIKYGTSLAQFDRVLTPSIYSQQVLGILGINADVLYHGVDSNFFKSNEGIKKEFFFGFLGMNDIRKQIPKIVEAYSKLGMTGNDLVINTTREGHYDIPSIFQNYNLPPNYAPGKFLGIPSTPDLILNFYNRIKAYVQCSSESFGLPSLEAASCELPNIASFHGASPEILGNASLYVNPIGYLDTNLGPIAIPDVNELEEKMRMLVDNPSLRKELGLKGRDRALLFDWNKPVEQLDKILEEEISIGRTRSTSKV